MSRRARAAIRVVAFEHEDVALAPGVTSAVAQSDFTSRTVWRAALFIQWFNTAPRRIRYIAPTSGGVPIALQTGWSVTLAGDDLHQVAELVVQVVNVVDGFRDNVSENGTKLPVQTMKCHPKGSRRHSKL